MNVWNGVRTTALAGALLAGAACANGTAADTKRDAGAALDAPRKAAGAAAGAARQAGTDAVDFTKDMAQKTADTTKALAGDLTDKSQAVAATAGEELTDGWITTKVKAQFAGDSVLRGSDIHVETSDRVVTLRGTVPSAAAKTHATEIARGTDRVTRVITDLTVK